MKDRTNGRKGYTETGSRWASWLRKMLPVVFFFYVFFLYYSLLSTPYFTDEQDVFFGAYNVIKGQDIYRAFLSQHMPFSYYLAAPIALCGARPCSSSDLAFIFCLLGCGRRPFCGIGR